MCAAAEAQRVVYYQAGIVVPVAVGGNGGNAAADAIQEECEKQGVHTLVAACPKSIDSDILVVSRGLRRTHITSSLFPM